MPFSVNWNDKELKWKEPSPPPVALRPAPTTQNALSSKMPWMAFFLMLTVMAVATLLLGLLLVYNTINAVILQQVSQIGVMKAIGARLLVKSC